MPAATRFRNPVSGRAATRQFTLLKLVCRQSREEFAQAASDAQRLLSSKGGMSAAPAGEGPLSRVGEIA
jgi:hypothetical protein